MNFVDSFSSFATGSFSCGIQNPLMEAWDLICAVQVSAFLAGLFHSRLIERVLIVAPKTLLAHWTKELSVVGLKHKIREYRELYLLSSSYDLSSVILFVGANHLFLSIFDSYSGPSTNIRNYELQYAFKASSSIIRIT